MCKSHPFSIRMLRIILGLFLLHSVNVNAEITPYLQTPTANSIWVSWKTDSGAESIVEYGLAEDELEKSVSGDSQALSSSYQYHSVQLTGLQADTLYYYRAKTGTETSVIHRFKTQPINGESSGHFRILILGDHQIRAEDRYLKLVNAAKQKLEDLYGSSVEESINLILNDGDQVDVGTLDHYENLHFAQSAPLSPNLPIMTTVGNHEYYSDGNLANYRAHFIYDGTSYQGIAPAEDESYYAYQSGRVLFVHLNSMRADVTQRQWLTQIVNAADQDSSVDWVISIIHHPYQAEQYVGDISGTFRNSWMEIMSNSPKHVLNIGGHHHLYARGQTREWPTYHIISGGTAWDQYWGQSTEIDFDDVQKTISNWAWQIVDIDIANQIMKVDTYAEAHPIIYKNNGQVMHYDSRLIDSFERKLNGTVPDKPFIANQISEAITLPYSFESSSYSSPGGELLNSTQFQIATDSNFSNLIVDRIRDFENIYGDTGAPLYEPVDIHDGVDILQWDVPAFGLTNGEHFVRVRHRDRNVEWSEWSEALAFTVEGSTNGPPELTLEHSRYESGDGVTVTYVNGYSNAKDWLAVYKIGQEPGSTEATSWTYVPSANGVYTFSGLADGEYYVTFMEDDSYTEIAPRIPFYVGPVTTLSADKSKYAEGDSVNFTYSGSPGGSKDWIGVYRMGQKPGSVNSTKWGYTPASSGNLSISGLGKGYYFAAFFINDGYTEVSERVYFGIGDEIVQIATSKEQYDVGEPVEVMFSGGRGGLKDYIGIFAKIPGVEPDGDSLLAYGYFDGALTGDVTIAKGFTGEDIPAGEYVVGMYENDGYDRISNEVCILIGIETGCTPEPGLSADKSAYLLGESVVLHWENTSGNSNGWIGIYPQGQEPGVGVDATQRSNISGTSGSIEFSELAAGSYYAVVFLDNGYTETGARVNFTVENPVPGLVSSKTSYSIDESIEFEWTNTPGNSSDWIGVYREGEIPGPNPSLVWSYLTGSSGTTSFGSIPAGNYFAVVFLDGGYTEGTSRAVFSVVEPAALTVATASVNVGEVVSLSWTNTPGGSSDWIGIYKAGETPGSIDSTQWSYISGSSGSINFSGLAEGEYYAVVLLDGGYEEATNRVSISVIAPAPVAGDLNGDGSVSVTDRNVLRSGMGQCSGDAGFDSSADLNNDGCIDNRDYREWLTIYRQQ